MKRVPVKSSAIASVGYDPEGQVLEIEFTSGTISQYDGVPQERADGLVAAASAGKYFQQYILGYYTMKGIGG